MDEKTCLSRTGRKYRVLEYLWDFSFSRFPITKAILQETSAPPVRDGGFELLLVAESELGDSNEICRDLLKLLDARTSLRCLVFRQPQRPKTREKLYNRMLRVLHNHAYFHRDPGFWLFVALSCSKEQTECELYTLNDALDAFIPVPPTPFGQTGLHGE